MRVRAERTSLEGDHSDCGELAWLLQRVWWNDVDEWKGRRDERMGAFNSLKKTCLDLLEEIRKIDGSASAHEFDVLYSIYQVDDRQLVGHYIDDMKDAMDYGDEDRCVGSCNSLFDLFRTRLRSEEVKQGLKALIKKQDHFRNTFMDYATVAIFFSSITATTLRFSYASADSSVSSKIVNICWFASLVLSIASATNSFLGAIVHQSPEFLRPSQALDYRLQQRYFRYMPTILLSISGMLFLIGFCGFTFPSQGSGNIFPSQGKTVQGTTISLTTTNLLAIFIMVLMAFTNVVHRAAGVLLQSAKVFLWAASLILAWWPIRRSRHLAIVLAFMPLLLLTLVFLFPYHLVRGRGLPSVHNRYGWKVWSHFGDVGEKLDGIFVYHWDEATASSVARPICWLFHLAIVLASMPLLLVTLAFLSPYHLVCGRGLPTIYENYGWKVWTHFGDVGEKLDGIFDYHWDKVTASSVTRPIRWLFHLAIVLAFMPLLLVTLAFLFPYHVVREGHLPRIYRIYTTFVHGGWEVWLHFHWLRFGNVGKKLDGIFDHHWDQVVDYRSWNKFLKSLPGHWKSFKNFFRKSRPTGAATDSQA